MIPFIQREDREDGDFNSKKRNDFVFDADHANKPYFNFTTVSDDDDSPPLAITPSRRICPEALASLIRQQALWRLKMPPASPDDSLALVKYGSPQFYNSQLQAVLSRWKREDEPPSTVLVESVSSDEESDSEMDEDIPVVSAVNDSMNLD